MDLPKQKNVKKLLGIMSVVLMYRVLTCKLGNSRNISIICTFSVQGVRWPVMLIPPTLAIKGSNFSYNLKVCPRRFLYVHMYVHTVCRYRSLSLEKKLREMYVHYQSHGGEV